MKIRLERINIQEGVTVEILLDSGAIGLVISSEFARKQGDRTIEEFVQEFKRIARGSRYEGCPLIEEFKRGMNGAIRRKLIEVEN